MTTFLLVAIVVVALAFFFFFRRGAPGEADRELASARPRAEPSGTPRAAAPAGRAAAPGRPGPATAPADEPPASLDDRDVQLESSRAAPAPRVEVTTQRRSEAPLSMRVADVQTL